MIRSLIAITMILLSFQCAYSFNEDKCIPVAQKICLDESERIIEGYNTKQCWQYKEVLRCSGVEENHCSIFEDNRGCNEVVGKCLSQSLTGLCSHFEKKFVCGHTSNENLAVKLIDFQFTVLRDEQDFVHCDPSIKNELCELVEEKCVEPAATRNISGKDVYKDCWKWDRKYQCRTNTSVDECKPFVERGCKEIEQSCIHSENGRCEHYVAKFECEESKIEKVDCSVNRFCVGDSCDEQARNINTNFGLAASYLGTMSQMAKDQENCSCNKETDPICHERNINENECRLFRGHEAVCRKYTGEFNCCADRGFLRQIAKCNEAEKTLAREREANLCHFVGTWSGKGVIGKFKKKSSYCCFNSELARIIQEQGRAQLSRGWGDAQSPDCSPLSMAEINRIDFSKIDFSQLYDKFTSNAKQDFVAKNQKINEKISSYQNNPDELKGAINSKMKRSYEK